MNVVAATNQLDLVCFAAKQKHFANNLQCEVTKEKLEAGFSIRAGSRRNSPAISHELAVYLIETLPHILRLT